MKIKALKSDGEKKVIFIKKGTGTGIQIYKGNSDEQAVITGEGSLGPVSCTMGINTYKNVQTSGTKVAAIILLGSVLLTVTYLIYYRNKKLNIEK